MAAGLRIVVAGSRQVAASCRQLADRYQKAVEAGVYGLAQEIMTDSKQRVPVDFGALKGSGYVTRPTVKSRRVSVELGYGGPAKDYAVVQHERTEFNHEVGEAKYLENAINAASGSAARRIFDIARQAFVSGTGPSGGVLPTNPNAGQRGGGSGGEG